MVSRKLALLLMLALFTAACQPETPVPETPAATPTPVLADTPTPAETAAPTDTATPELTLTPASTSTPETTPTGTPTAASPERPEESILILEPGTGSRVTSPIRVAGISDPTFEQTLVVRAILDDGTELVVVPTTIQADIGERGEFEAEVPIELTEERNIFLQVYATSARDGGITHLSSTVVMYTPTGPQEITSQEPHPEQIAIFQPQIAETIRGGVARVEGFGLASFEQTLVAEVLDADGNVIGMEPITVQAPDLGIPGPFSAEVSYTLSEAGPGRIVVRDISPAHGDNTHLSSVEVNLEP